uniref:CUB_2 domain-containing protein n=1 Tax=Caenorhabditis japonica TaxID=281687 RepID=A0A8R1DG17_CAEJA
MVISYCGAFYFSLYLLVALLTSSSDAIDFTCPSKNITGGGGVFPPDQLTLAQFPSNYRCSIGFEIQDGFLVQLNIESNVTDLTQDSLIVVDALSKLRIYSEGVSYFVAPAKTASVVLQSQSGTAQFWFRYNYVYARYNEQVKYATGVPFSLYFVLNKYYTVSSPNNESIVINTALIGGNDDIQTVNIYVYDGPDILSKYVGTLYEFVNMGAIGKSTGNSLTFLNMYGNVVNSYGLANEYSAISRFNSYNFNIFSDKSPIVGSFTNLVGNVNAFTFFCPYCDNKAYVTKLTFVGDTSGETEVQFNPLTPSNPLNTSLTYKSSDSLNQYWPQLIPGNLFTLTTTALQFLIRIDADKDAQADWLKPFSGRKGVIFSQSLWSVGSSPAFDYKFESPDDPMTFNFNLQSVIITQPNEQINVEIGSPGANPFNTVFNKTVSNPGVRVANGTFMEATFNATSSQSSAIVTFEMMNANGIPPTSTTTETAVETTTKLTRGVLDGLVVICCTAVVLRFSN